MKCQFQNILHVPEAAGWFKYKCTRLASAVPRGQAGVGSRACGCREEGGGPPRVPLS